MSCPRAGCGKSARPFDEGVWNRATWALRHRQTKGAATDMPNLKPPRQTLTNCHFPRVPNVRF